MAMLMSETRVLVCQGTCSPMTPVFDQCRLLDEAAAAVVAGTRLVHTPHEYESPAGLGRAYWRCVRCGTRRQF